MSNASSSTKVSVQAMFGSASTGDAERHDDKTVEKASDAPAIRFSLPLTPERENLIDEFVVDGSFGFVDVVVADGLVNLDFHHEVVAVFD